MNDASGRFEEAVREARRRKLVYALACVPFVLALVWFMTPNAGHTEQVSGIILRLDGVPRREGERLYLRVRLDDGREVRARIPRSVMIRESGGVELVAQYPLTFGNVTYRFHSYEPVSD